MVQALVAGGTGTAGRQVVKEFLARGHSVRVLTRHGGAPGTEIAHFHGDLVTGDGLAEALDGVDVVVDTTDGKTKGTRAVLEKGSENLLATADGAGVRRAVLLSIVNVDLAEFAYYQSKRTQERVYDSAAIETVIVRATQFHDFIPMIAKPASRVGLIPAFSKTSFQTIDTRDVATALVDAALATEPAPEGPITIGGPEVRTARDLTTAWKKATGTHGFVVNVPLPGALGQFLRNGSNLVPDNRFGTITFDRWLAESVH
ncbi:MULTISPECIES: SDR family oxidoreductase [Rhodococcus]|uniref:NAD(P)H-binding protein n=1 Tax=Rhodococcus pseudokoreensis TaxID=2811421 RepID=A0A974VZY0_9NOCA|nr:MULTISPECIES: NAD(P)H-binding protein [Rhodococcus]MBV6760166.1 NAD(P)H-binding protein [Rhodococcus opacus]QSE88738.1 NAD(P)H-binding protein [Rhodococcus pseudokoreensis]